MAKVERSQEYCPARATNIPQALGRQHTHHTRTHTHTHTHTHTSRTHTTHAQEAVNSGHKVTPSEFIFVASLVLNALVIHGESDRSHTSTHTHTTHTHTHTHTYTHIFTGLSARAGVFIGFTCADCRWVRILSPFYLHVYIRLLCG